MKIKRFISFAFVLLALLTLSLPAFASDSELMSDNTNAISPMSISYTTYSGSITNGISTKTCKAVFGYQQSSSYISFNIFVQGLSGIHAQSHINATTTVSPVVQKYSCNMNSDASTFHSDNGKVIDYDASGDINATCLNDYTHTTNSGYNSWSWRVGI